MVAQGRVSNLNYAKFKGSRFIRFAVVPPFVKHPIFSFSFYASWLVEPATFMAVTALTDGVRQIHKNSLSLPEKVL